MANEGNIITVSSAKERSVGWWQDAIRNGQRFQNKYGGSSNWSRYKDYYRHNWQDGVLPVNQIFSIMRSMVAQTYFKNPSVTVTPSRPGIIYQLHAMIVERLDRWLLRELGTKHEIKSMIQDAFLTGIGVGFNGYDSEFGYDPKKKEGDSPYSFTQFDKKGYKIEYNSYVNPGMPWFLRCRPDDVVFPWGTTSAKDAPWVAMRKFRNINDLKKDPKYKVPKDLRGSHVPYRTGPEGEVKQDGFMDVVQDNAQWLETWQINDAKTGKVIGITMQTDDFLRNDNDHMQIDGLPVETLIFNPDPDYIYGIADAKIIEPQLLELNEIRTQAMKHRRVDLLKMLYKKGAMKTDVISKLLDEDVKAAIEVDSDENLRDVVLPLPSNVGGILQDMGYAAELARQDIRETVGFSRVQQGEFQGKTHVTKTEVNQVMARSDIRMDERRDAVVDLLTNIVRKFNQTIFTHWTVPIVRDILGPDGAKYWVQFSGPEIKGEYNIKIDPYSAGTIDPEKKKADAIEMMRAWAEINAGAIKQGVPVPAELQRYFFSQYEGINVDNLIRQQGIQQPTGSPNQPMGVPQAAQAMLGGQG